MSSNEKEENTIYCVFCGTKNNINTESCSKCNKTLHPKNNLFKDFLYDHIKDDLKGKVKDNIFSYLKNYIISHLYGSVMFLSLVFTAITITSTLRPYKTISSIDDLKKKTNNSNVVTIRVYTYDDSCATDFDEELIDIPFTSGGAISGLRRLVSEITIKKGSTINTWCNNNHTEELICKETLDIYDSSIDKNAKEYREKVLEYATWVRTNGISNSSLYAKWNKELDQLSYNILLPENLSEYNKNKEVTKSIDLFVPIIGCSYED